jgi:hypothetical protein
MQINKIRDEKEDIITNTSEIQRIEIIFRKPISNKLDNLEEIDLNYQY